MKLIIEINECPTTESYRYDVRPLIATDEREGDEIYDKKSQSGEVARLIDLSEKVKEAVEIYGKTIS